MRIDATLPQIQDALIQAVDGNLGDSHVSYAEYTTNAAIASQGKMDARLTNFNGGAVEPGGRKAIRRIFGQRFRNLLKQPDFLQ